MVGETLLGENDPVVFRIERARGTSPFLLTCDHAGRSIPRRLQDLGLSEQERSSHMGWDLGVAALGDRLSERLDAFLILHNYSRLVIDPNRPPWAPDSIPTLSERTRITANDDLSPADRDQRFRELFQPYHQRLREELDARLTTSAPCVLVALHTFTPIYLDERRPWHIGVLYGRDARLGRRLGAELRKAGAWNVADNEPYSVSDDTDYTIIEHGERRNIPHVEIEIRQDLLETQSDIQDWAERLGTALEKAMWQLECELTRIEHKS